jgi:glucose/mannose-6-phosphate isomerase
MVDLDNAALHERLDQGDMRGRIRELPAQCLKAWQQALEFELPEDYAGVDKVVVLGMGGSAIGGDLLRSLQAAHGKVPVTVSRDYDLPAFVDGNTLVIASSYSGNTEETLSAFAQALSTPAKKLALTTGGRLRALAEMNGIPVFVISYDAQPRAALAHSFLPLLAISQNLGILTDKSDDVEEMVRVLEDVQSAVDDLQPMSTNPAKQLAARVNDRIVVIYGAGTLAPVAQRWKTQVNENSKAWAFCELLPELNHNAVVGYEFPPDLAQRIFVILLRSSHLHDRILARYRITSEVLTQANVEHEIIEASGESPLSQMMSLVLFGDWLSYYLALLYEADPTPVKAIDYLKRRLAEG